jgi:hypothetical protein
MTSGKIHRDAQTVTDPELAAFIVYLGHEIQKCTNPERGLTIFTFLIPAFDFDILREEFYRSDETAVCIKAYVNALKSVRLFQNQAKNIGEYISPNWRRIIAAK